MNSVDRLATYEDGDASDSEPLTGRQWFNYAIGSAVMSASCMDVAIGNLYGALLRTDLDTVVAYGQPFETTRTACLAALDALPAHEIYDLARNALHRAKDFYEDRNAIAHGVWGGEQGSVNNTRRAVRYRRHGRVSELEWTQRGLMFLAAAMIDMEEELNALTKAVSQLRPLY